MLMVVVVERVVIETVCARVDVSRCGEEASRLSGM